MALNLLVISALVVAAVAFHKFILYPSLLSPLSKIPNAHPTAPIAPLWILWIRWQNRANRTIYAAHKRLGPVVRLGPSEVSVNCVDDGLRTIYAGGFEKPDWYSNAFKNFGCV